MKRLIFTLLYRDGHYLLSRNFRLQRVGDLEWVLRNYAIRTVSLGIDELMVLDLSESDERRDRFREEVRILGEECFVPLAVGGRIRSVDEVERLLAVGTDKVVLNTPFVADPGLCEAIAARFGSQALVAGIDVRREPSLAPGVRDGLLIAPEELASRVGRVLAYGAGEILLQSVDRDGTGNGLDLSLADDLGAIPVPLILMGGVGHADQIVAGLQHPAVDAVATANLFNFVGESLVEARRRCLDAGVLLPSWDGLDLVRLEGCLMTAGDGGAS
jgi:cyclase